MNDTTHDQILYANLTVKRQQGSEVEITAEIPVEVAHKYRMKALKHIVRELELPGFRKGHVPEDMAMKHIGEATLMHETADRALPEVYAQIIVDEKLDVVGRPNVTITKLAPGNPIGFKITSAVYPDITLPDYTKIAEEVRKKAEDPEKVQVTEEELDGELKKLQEMMTPKQELTGDRLQGAEGGETAEGTGEAEVVEKPKAPEINDDFARNLGDFTDLADLKEKIKKGMLMDKKQKTADARRLSIIEAILEKSKMDVPALFVEGELDQMVADFDSRIERAGVNKEEYLRTIQKTDDDLRKEWRLDAEKRAKIQLILSEIGKKENIHLDPKRVERDVAHVKEHYPEAEDSAVHTYVVSQMMNRHVFALLEGKKVEEEETGHEHGPECEHGHDEQ